MSKNQVLKLLIEIEELQKQLRTWKKTPANLLKEENKLYHKLRTLIRKKNKEIMSEFKKLDRVPSSDMDIRILITPLIEATIEYNDIIMENTQEAIHMGMERTKTELRKQGFGKKANSNMIFYLNGSLKDAIADIDFEEFSQGVSDRMKQDTFIASQGTIDRMSGDVMNNIKDSYEAGYGIDKAAVGLQDVFDGMEDWELKRVARTETNGAQNLGAEATMRQLGVVYDKWKSAGDARVRGNRPEDTADHRYLDGQISYVSGNFSNGLSRPGDRSGPIKEWIQCRCVLLPYLIPEGYTAPSGTFFYESDLILIEKPKPEPGLKPKPEPKIGIPTEERTGRALREELRETHKDARIRLGRLTEEKKLLNKEWDKMWKSRPKFGTEEYGPWNKEYAQMGKRMDENIRAKAALRNAIKEDLKGKLIFNKEGFDIKATINENFTKSGKKNINKAMKEFSKYIDEDLLRKDPEVFVSYLPKNGRAYAEGYKIAITEKESTKIIIHEMGHYLEKNSYGMHEKIQAFYDMRTKGEVAKWLGRGYRPDEIFKKDKFIDKYMGKVYKDATEVLSMGLENIYSNPIRLMEKDPEMFDFIIDIIRGVK